MQALPLYFEVNNVYVCSYLRLFSKELFGMEMADKAWKNVAESTIRNCFKTCGFVKGEAFLAQERTGEEMIAANQQADWNLLSSHEEIPVSFEEFVNVDDNVAISGSLSDEDILSSIDQNSDHEEDEDQEQLQEVCSSKEARGSLKKLRQYFIRQDVDDNVFAALVLLDNSLDRTRLESLSQKKITDFFMKN